MSSVCGIKSDGAVNTAEDDELAEAMDAELVEAELVDAEFVEAAV